MATCTTLLNEYHGLLTDAAEDPVTVETLSIDDSITAKDTLVVVDMQHDFLPGGAFGVAEGDQVIDGICELIGKFNAAGATVIATKDYHPTDHCSFSTHGGPFPPHCVMGTRGSLLHPTIAETLTPLIAKDPSTTHVVHKGFYKGVESFGGFPYSTATDDWMDRLSYLSKDDVKWTGAWKLRAANVANDANAPPDVMSILDRVPMKDLLPTEDGGRVFCCGLAMDYCVIDTASNYCQTAAPCGLDRPNCFIVQNLTRAAMVPGLGTFGRGFLTDPRVMLEKMASNKIGLVRFE